MNPEDIFKGFFGTSFDDFDRQRPKGSGGGSWSEDHHSETELFGDFHRQMHQQMEEMEKQMMDVFRIFQIPDLHSMSDSPCILDTPALSRPSENMQDKAESKARDQMLKDGSANRPSKDTNEISAFSFPRYGGLFSTWTDRVPKMPYWENVCPQEMGDSDLDSRKLSSEEIADLLVKKKDESPSKQPCQRSMFPGVSFFGNSVKIQRVIGKDGMIEERKTVRDSSGREETTVTRKIGDSSHTVMSIRDEQGQEEKREIFNNLDKDKISDFNQQWNGERSVTAPATRDGVLSDDTRSIFRKLFRF